MPNHSAQASGFQKIAKIDHFWHFYELLAIQNVNEARFARNVKRDFFCDFQTPIRWTNFYTGRISTKDGIQVFDILKHKNLKNVRVKIRNLKFWISRTFLYFSAELFWRQKFKYMTNYSKKSRLGFSRTFWMANAKLKNCGKFKFLKSI